MRIETELLHYGYLFIFAGAIVEGDATLLTAAFLAHRGYFRLSLVLAVAALSTLLANQVYYALARRSGMKWLTERQNGRLERILRWSQSHGILLLVASRFMTGFRTIIPVVCGATGMPPLRFTLWNSVGAVIWAGAFGSAGYLGGHALSLMISHIRRHEITIATFIAVGVGGFILWRTHGRELYDAWSLRFYARNSLAGPKNLP